MNKTPPPAPPSPAIVLANTNPETHVIAVISMSHICPQTSAWLETRKDREPLQFSVWESDYGFVLPVPATAADSEVYAVAPQLHMIITWARTEGYAYVMLDRDAGVTTYLPTYEWS